MLQVPSLVLLVLCGVRASSAQSGSSTLFRPCQCPTKDCFCMRTRNCSHVDHVTICERSVATIPVCGAYEQCCSVPLPLLTAATSCEESCPDDDQASGVYGSCGVWSVAGLSHMPWTASLIYLNDSSLGPICGVTIIHPRVVITAAGCLKEITADGNLYVVAGTDRILDMDKDLHAQLVKVRRSAEMLYYADGSEDFDLALLELEAPLTRDHGFVDVACLQQPDSRLDLCNCWAAGLEQEVSSSLKWRSIQVRVLKFQTCENLFWDLKSKEFTLLNGFTCAVGDSSVCSLDYGGPVVCPLVEDRLRFVLAGVLADPIACDDPAIPTLLVNTGYFAPWIQRTLESLGYENYAVHPRY